MAFLAYPVFVVGAAMGTSIAALGFYTCATEDDEEETQVRLDRTTTTTYFAPAAPAPVAVSQRDLEVERMIVRESLETANAEERSRQMTRESLRRDEEATRLRSLRDAAPPRGASLVVTAHCAHALDASWFEARRVPVLAQAHLYDRHGDFVETSSSRPSDGGGDVGAPVWSEGRGAITLAAVLRRSDLGSVQVVLELVRRDSGESLGRTALVRVAALCDGTPRDLRLVESLGVLTLSVAFEEGDANARLPDADARLLADADDDAAAARAPSAPAAEAHRHRPPPRNPFLGDDDGPAGEPPVAARPASAAGITDAVALPLAEATVPVATCEVPVADAAPAWLEGEAAAYARPVYA